MEPLKAGELIQATGGRCIRGNLHATINSFSIDTRTLKKGDFFIPLVGKNFNGHDFIPEALTKGASGFFISEREEIAERYREEVYGNDQQEVPVIICVTDTLSALQQTAHFHRSRFNPLIVAVTGSNGKTTTKEMIAGIFSCRWCVLKTEGNYNNEIGVPLTLLSMTSSHRAAVIELGMNAPGEINCLAGLVHPAVGVVTNVGAAHLAAFPDIEAVAKAKGELLVMLPEDGIAILNRDDDTFPTLSQLVRGQLVTFGFQEEADFSASNIEHREGKEAKFKINDEAELSIHACGIGNIANALAASAVARTVGFSWEEIREGLNRFNPLPGRMVFEKRGTLTVIDDTYNANPISMRVSLEFLAGLPGRGRKVAILGDMLELGEESNIYHLEIGKLAGKLALDILITVGDFAPIMIEGAQKAGIEADNLYTFATVEKALEKLLQIITPHDTILVKGSREIKMERIIDKLRS